VETSEVFKTSEVFFISYICDMTTLTTEIPERFEKAIRIFVEQTGGKIISVAGERAASIEDENLTPTELELFKKALKEISLIKDGKVKSIPFSELWKD
jgi:hypothetical protein